MTNLLTTIGARARNALGAFGANAVIALVVAGGLPMWAQVAIFVAVWGALEFWTRSPDSDGDGVPDWLEARFPKEARVLELAIARGWDDLIAEGLDRIARRVIRRQQGVDPGDVDARSPWWVAIAALALLSLTACGGAQSVSTASESVAGTVTGAASFDCDAGGCERDGVGTAEIVATAEVCLDLFGGPVFCWPLNVEAAAFITDDRAEAWVCVDSAPFLKPACVSTAGE